MVVNKMTLVGERVPKYDGLGHVTGTTMYVDDHYIPGTLICKGLRSPVSRGKIKRLDTSLAEKLPGVAAVITAKDVPFNAYAGDWPVFPEEDICFKGQLLAAVAAVDEDTALEAISLIKIEIEEETPIFDVREAMKPGAPKIRPDGNLLKFGERDYYFTNQGDVEAGFKEADFVLEEEYFYPVAEHTPMEPQVSLAVPHPNGSLTVYTTSQCLYFHIGQLCAVLKLPFSKLNYVGATVGGGFGGKNDLHADPVTALLALKTGKPVKWRWTREEELNCSTVRGAWLMRIKDGVKNNGRIVAREMESTLDGGAYLSFNPYATTKHAYYAVGPYYIPNVRVITRCVFTNKVPSSSMRGFGVTPCSYAVEVHMEKIARKLGMDPFEFRMINALRKGEPTHTGSIPDSVAAIEVMQKLAESAGIKLPDKLMSMKSDERRL
jgi:CO/xanthine dehydrogenase Mo-binding subunit